MPSLASALLLLTIACDVPGTAVPIERLQGPDEVLITDVVSSVSTQRVFPLTNHGTRGVRVFLSVPEPFFLPFRDVYIGPGATVNVRVGVNHPGFEALEAELTVVGPYHRTVVSVRATFDRDVDGDGFIAIEAGGDDCDDRNPDVHPGAPERCDGRDNDCNGLVDDDPVDAPSWYRDADRDGYGRDDDTRVQCLRPVGFVSIAGDCDDTDPAIHPGATEIWYDGVDQNCDGWSDFDQDRDGYDHHFHGGDDCWDTNPNVNPGVPERDNGIDDNCNGLVDETFLSPGDLLITELHVNPEARTPDRGQFVEILNTTTTRTIHLAAMRFESAGSAVLLPAHALGPGKVALLCAHLTPTWNGGLSCVARLPALLTEDDHISITAAWLLDEVAWTGWAWPVGASLQLGALDHLANDDEAAWCPGTTAYSDGDLGSPGTVPACE